MSGDVLIIVCIVAYDSGCTKTKGQVPAGYSLSNFFVHNELLR